MKNAFRIFWEALKDFWDELFFLILMNILTVLLAIPVVTFPPALGGLWSAANRVANGKSIAWSNYFEGFRRYFWKTWRLTLLNVLVIIIVLTNIWFYTPDNTPFTISANLSILIRTLFAALALLWLLYQMYPLALLMEQSDQRLRVALRNAAAVFVTKPTFTIVLGLLLLLVIVISVVFPMLWFLGTLALFAVVCNKAVLHLLEPYREKIAKAKNESKKMPTGG